jgi:hypothetical protein
MLYTRILSSLGFWKLFHVRFELQDLCKRTIHLGLDIFFLLSSIVLVNFLRISKPFDTLDRQRDPAYSQYNLVVDFIVNFTTCLAFHMTLISSNYQNRNLALTLAT